MLWYNILIITTKITTCPRGEMVDTKDLKSLKNSLKDVKRIRSKDLQTLKKLKGNIQKEKGIVR